MYVVVQHANKIELMYRSTAKTGKHTDPVWQVRSCPEHQQNLTPSFLCIVLLRSYFAEFLEARSSYL